MSVILKADIKRKLKEIGLESGDNVIVHTSLKSMDYVCGGAQAVIEALIAAVENGEISEAPLFLNRSGKPIQAKSVGNIISNVRDELGDKCVKRSFYDLRSTFATNLAGFMLKKNLPIGFIQYKLMRLLGHSDFSTTQKYINFARSETFDKQMASWVDKLFGDHLMTLQDEMVAVQGGLNEQ